jgi:hypothetical protein
MRFRLIVWLPMNDCLQQRHTKPILNIALWLSLCNSPDSNGPVTQKCQTHKCIHSPCLWGQPNGWSRDSSGSQTREAQALSKHLKGCSNLQLAESPASHALQSQTRVNCHSWVGSYCDDRQLRLILFLLPHRSFSGYIIVEMFLIHFHRTYQSLTHIDCCPYKELNCGTRQHAQTRLAFLWKNR